MKSREEIRDEIIEEGEEPDEYVTLPVRLTRLEKEMWRARSGKGNMSSRARDVITNINRAEDEMDARADVENINAVVLKTYIAALEKSKQTIEGEVNKLKKQVDEIEEDEEDEVLFTVELDLDIEETQ